MVNIPTDSPIPLIEFELMAFKNALALQSSSSNSKPVLIFPNNLDPIINRLIRILASRLQLQSTLVGDYESEVVLIYAGNYNRGEQDQITLEDVIVAKSLGVSGSQQTREIEAQPSTSSVPSSISAALDLPTKKGDGGVESHLKPSTSSTKSFEYGEQPAHLDVEQPAHGKRKAKTKWIDSMPPMNLEESKFQSFSDDPSPTTHTSNPQKMTDTSAKSPEELSWTEDWGSHELILLPSGYLNNVAPELLFVFTERVPGTVCYCDKHGQQLEVPAVIYIMPPDNDEEGPSDDDEEDRGRHSPTPGPSNRP